MSDRDIRQLRAKIQQLTSALASHWEMCPRNFSSYTEEERDKHSHAYGYCADGLLENGYADPPVCEVCGGAGEVLVTPWTRKKA